jgi:hypothetical protein
MKTQEFDMLTVFKSIDDVKPQKGTAYIEKQLSLHAKKFAEYIENGYSEEQIFNAFPPLMLTDVELDKKTFIRKLKFAINKYKKTLVAALPAIPATIPAVIIEDEASEAEKFI